MDTLAIAEALLHKNGGNVTAAAAAMGVPRTTFRGYLARAEKAPKEKPYRRHLVISDVQAKPGVPLDHLTWAGKYAAEKKPDVIIVIGDWPDLPSLSAWDRGKKSAEGRRYKADIEASTRAMELFMAPIQAEPGYNPEKEMVPGNHDDRIRRYVEEHAELEGTMSSADLKFESWGWRVHPYLKPVMIDGVAYCHFFTSGVMGRPISSAKALITKKHMSCVMGHVQTKQLDIQYNAMGKRLTGIFTGAFYQHDEDYLNPQGNAETWRGIWMLNQVRDGEFDEMPISLDYLRRRYGG